MEVNEKPSLESDAKKAGSALVLDLTFVRRSLSNPRRGIWERRRSKLWRAGGRLCGEDVLSEMPVGSMRGVGQLRGALFPVAVTWRVLQKCHVVYFLIFPALHFQQPVSDPHIGGMGLPPVFVHSLAFASVRLSAKWE